MRYDETRTLYAMLCATWRRDPTDAEVAGWHVAFEDEDADQVAAAARLIIKEDRAFMPRPGEVLDVVRRLAGDIPPTVEEAIGLYAAGDHGHPLVALAVERLGRERLDPRCADPKVARDARFEFRSAYAAVLAAAEDDKLRPTREALAAGTGGLLELLGGA